MSHRKHIGKLIKRARIRRNMKADDVAELCNVSRSRVYQWEADVYIFPKNIKLLSIALRVPEKRLRQENKKQPRVQN